MDLSICSEIKLFSQDPWLSLMVLMPFGNGDLVYFFRKFLLAANYTVQVWGEKKAVLYVVRQWVWEKSDNRAHVKGGTSSNTAFRLQAVHELTNHPFDDLYPAHFDHAFFSEQQVTACVSILQPALSFSLLYRETEFPVVLSA